MTSSDGSSILTSPPLCPSCGWDETTYDVFYQLWECRQCDWVWSEEDEPIEDLDDISTNEADFLADDSEGVCWPRDYEQLHIPLETPLCPYCGFHAPCWDNDHDHFFCTQCCKSFGDL